MGGHYGSSLKDSIMEGGAEGMSESMKYGLIVIAIIVVLLLLWYMMSGGEGVTAGGCHVSSSAVVSGSACGEGYQARKEWMENPSYSKRWSQILGQKSCQDVNAQRAELIREIGCSDMGVPLDCTVGGPYVDAAGNFMYKSPEQQNTEAWGWMADPQSSSEATASSMMAANKGPEGFMYKREGLSDNKLTMVMRGL